MQLAEDYDKASWIFWLNRSWGIDPALFLVAFPFGVFASVSLRRGKSARGTAADVLSIPEPRLWIDWFASESGNGEADAPTLTGSGDERATCSVASARVPPA